jgi:hypothetical protein
LFICLAYLSLLTSLDHKKTQVRVHGYFEGRILGLGMSAQVCSLEMTVLSSWKKAYIPSLEMSGSEEGGGERVGLGQRVLKQ